MRISLSLTASIFAILVASCGGDDEDPSSGATSGDPSGVSSTTGSSTTSGSGGASSSSSGVTSGSGGDPSTSSTGGASSSSGATSGSGGDPSTSSAGGSTSSSGGSTGDGGSGGEPPIVDSGLPVPPGAADKPKPSGAVGGLKVLDWAGFTGAVSYSFDDNNSTQIQHYDRLNGLGVPFTFYIWTGKGDANNPVWKRALEDGHEIGNHTRDHQSNDPGGGSTDAAQQWIKQTFGIEAYTMAAPNGSGEYTGIARTRFLINRGVSNAVIAPNDNSDPFTLPTYIPPTNASASAMDQQITSARQAKGWRTFCIHGFTGGNDGAYQPIPIDAFVQHVQNTKNLGDMWIDTMANVGAYWRGQKAVTSAVSGGGCTTANGETTCTWQLPDHFPPGKYLRVTVTGGTPKQGGVPLRWDPHGYYEMALDAKSITISQ